MFSIVPLDLIKVSAEVFPSVGASPMVPAFVIFESVPVCVMLASFSITPVAWLSRFPSREIEEPEPLKVSVPALVTPEVSPVPF